MVRNTIGGNGHKRVSKGKRRSKNPNLAVDITTGVDHYAQVQKRLGGNRLSILLDDGQEVQAVIPGKFFKKLWFNPGDFIHVRCENGNYYDVIQKLLDPTEQQNAASALGKKLDDGEHNIFRPDVQEDDDDDDFDMGEINEQDEGEGEDGGASADENFNDDKLSRNERKAQMMRNVTKGSVNIDKFQRKLNEKERDLSRRENSERDFSQIPKSIVKDSDNSTSESSEEKEADDEDADVDIDAI